MDPTRAVTLSTDELAVYEHYTARLLKAVREAGDG